MTLTLTRETATPLPDGYEWSDDGRSLLVIGDDGDVYGSLAEMTAAHPFYMPPAALAKLRGQ